MGRYVETTDVIKMLGEDPSDAAMVADVNFMIGIAEDLVDQYCRSILELREDEELIVSGKGIKLLVPREFIKELTSVELIDEDGVSQEEYDCVIMPDNPQWGSGRWIERRDGLNFPEGKKNIKITGDFGIDPLPSQIPFCVAYTIKSLFQRRQVDEFIAMESGNGRLIELKDAQQLNKYIPATARGILDQFRNSASFG